MTEDLNNKNSEEFRNYLGIPEDLWKKVILLYKKYRIEYDEKKYSFVNFYGNIIYMLSQCASNEEELSTTLEYFRYLFTHREFLINIGLVHPNYYDEFTQFIEVVLRSNNTLGMEMICSYIVSIENKTDPVEVISSLLMNQDFINQNESLLRDKPMEEFYNNAGVIYEQLLKNYNEFSFKLIMFDLILKFGYIIESHMKEINLFLLKGFCLKNDNNQQYYWIEEENKRNNLSIGKILKELKSYEKDFDARMSKLRNAITKTLK